MAQETSGYWMGPMPVQQYFAKFLPLDEDTKDDKGKKVTKAKEAQKQPAPERPQIPSSYFQDKEVNKESDIYEHLIEVFNGEGEFGPISPGYVLINTSQHPDPDSRPGSQGRVDINQYREGAVSPDRPNNMGIALSSMEIKGTRVDAFCSASKDDDDDDDDDDETPFEAKSDSKCAIRGQLATYATEICQRQHRTHFFMIYIFHPFVRFIRWDRSGIIVSEKFNYLEDCTPLVEFMWRFGQLDDVGKGFDPTVTFASEDEAIHARTVLAKWTPDVPRPVFKMEVPDDTKTRQFLVWGSLAEADSPLGRATKGYPAVEVLEDGKLSKDPVFLKEQWRSESVRPEVDTLKVLNDAKVINVPTLVCGGDIRAPDRRAGSADDGGPQKRRSPRLQRVQTTQSHEYTSAPWRLVSKNRDSVIKIERRIHTRLVVAEVGTPLERFESSHEMLSAVYDAFLGHKDAIAKCELLHRDVSAGNILILENGRGILNDWDLARKLSDLGKRSRCSERTGTWPFMSLALLQEPTKIHTIRDDLESFYWVVLYLALVYVPHTNVKGLPDMVEKIFNEYSFTDPDGLARGGSGKRDVLDGGYVGRNAHMFKFYDCAPLTKFVKDVAAELHRWKEDDWTEKGKWEDLAAAPPDWLADPLQKCHDSMEQFYEQALRAPGWPENDYAVNQIGCKRAGHRVSLRKRSPDPDDVAPDVRRSDKKPKQSHNPPAQRPSGSNLKRSHHSSRRR